MLGREAARKLHRENLAHPQFFPLGHGPGERGEGYSPTLNKGAVPFSLTGGILSLLPTYLQLPAISSRKPSTPYWARVWPPDSEWVNTLPPAWLFYSTSLGARPGPRALANAYEKLGWASQENLAHLHSARRATMVGEREAKRCAPEAPAGISLCQLIPFDFRRKEAGRFFPLYPRRNQRLAIPSAASCLPLPGRPSHFWEAAPGRGVLRLPTAPQAGKRSGLIKKTKVKVGKEKMG